MGVLVLTSVHHLYGAWRFATPWRVHVAHIGVTFSAVLIASLILAYTKRGFRIGRFGLWVFLLTTMVVCVLQFGIYEGGYNHLLKIILHWSGLPDSQWRALYPASLYEPPEDFWFELTGVLQLPVALVAEKLCLHLHRAY
ncbi:MAG: hypothetical protein AB7O65_08715 [Candidatus Korobacteraceae bacterium]